MNKQTNTQISPYLQIYIVCILCIQFCLTHQKFGANNDKQQYTLNMAKEFGKKHDATTWVLHYMRNQDESWKWYYQNVVKKFGGHEYYGANEILLMNSSRWIGSPNRITLNLYVNENLRELNHMLDKELASHVQRTPYTRWYSDLHISIWLFQFPNNSIENPSLDLLRKLPLNYGTMTFGFTYHKKGKIEIYDIYKVSRDAKVILKKFGIWSPEYGLQVYNTNIWSRRNSLGGHHFRIVSAINPPAVTYVEDNCTTKICFRGMYADVWHDLSKKMNFTYTSQRAYQWGSLINGTWNGMIRMLEQEEVDIAVTSHQVTKQRSTVVDYLPTLTHAPIRLYLRKPNDEIHINAVVKPFTSFSWLGVALMLFFVPILLAGMVSCISDEFTKEFHLVQCYWFLTQTLTMHSTRVMPNLNSHMIGFGSVMLAGIVIYYYWEAMLISYLAVRRTELPFKTMSDLAANSNYKLLVGRGTSHLDQFRYSNEPLYTKLWIDKIAPYADNLPLFKDLPNSILEDSYSVGFYDDGMKYNEAYLDCRIIDTGVIVSTFQYAWTIQKQSHFNKAFTYNIKKMLEIGAVHRYFKAYEAQDQFCPDASGKPLTINQCISAFIIILSGFFGCITILGLERYIPYEWINWYIAFRNRVARKIRPLQKKRSSNHLVINSRMTDKLDRMMERYNNLKTELFQLDNQMKTFMDSLDSETS